jgi:tRNA(Ile)-lysidine synthase
MLENIKSILTHICALHPTRPVLVGVSGGPDSLCLLHVLHQSGYPLVVACLNHGLRPESASEVELVQHIAETLGVDFDFSTVDTQQFASQMSLSIEAAARQLRYEFLFAQAARVNAQAVAVGHTADDQAETVLMHLLRGAGLAGLKGMEFRSWLKSWSTDIPLVRPLLTTWRSEILEYCHLNGLTPAQDATNQSLDYFRNRLRLEILPYLEQFQPNIRQHLVRMAGTLALDYELLQSQVQVAWDALLVDRGQGYLAFHRAKFVAQPVAVQRYLLRQAMLALRTGTQDIELAMIERARTCLARTTGHRTCDLGAGLQLRVEQDTAWVIVRGADLPAGEWPAVLTAQVIKLPIPGNLDLPAGWVIQSLRVAAGEPAFQAFIAHPDPYQAWFDADRVVLPLQVRSRRTGDRMQPAGMGGKTVKLSDLMINLKLPYRSRATWPIVCAGEEIVWVPGCRQSLIARPDESTRRLLQLKLIRLPESGEEN